MPRKPAAPDSQLALHVAGLEREAQQRGIPGDLTGAGRWAAVRTPGNGRQTLQDAEQSFYAAMKEKYGLMKGQEESRQKMFAARKAADRREASAKANANLNREDLPSLSPYDPSSRPNFRESMEKALVGGTLAPAAIAGATAVPWGAATRAVLQGSRNPYIVSGGAALDTALGGDPLSGAAMTINPVLGTLATHVGEAEAGAKGIPMLIEAAKMGFMPAARYRTPTGQVFNSAKEASEAVRNVTDAYIEPVLTHRNKELLDRNEPYFNVLKNLGGLKQFCQGGPVEKFAGGGLARIARRLSADAAPARKGVADVIKEKGGNWLTRSVEDATMTLKTPVVPDIWPHADDINTRSAPINDWIDKQLTRYVKNEMATPEDPIRALAEKGVLHYQPPRLSEQQLTDVSLSRPKWGFPAGGLGEEFMTARPWEDVADLAMMPRRAEDQIMAEYPWNAETMPWLKKLDPKTPVHALYPYGFDNLGFGHLTDELSNAMRPDSGLPRELMLDPKSLSRVSVPQAVERVAKINAWRAAQKAEADALRANNAATSIFKEYPENNPQGLRWVELAQPKGLPEGWKLNSYDSGGRRVFDVVDPQGNVPKTLGKGYPSEEAATKAYLRTTTSLQDALKYEGDTMGHCVGGYCDEVLSGRTRIMSLRDAKGQPHVTVEIRPDVEDFERGVARRELSPENFAARYPDELGQRIVQIKGKQNKAPNPEYLPFVQDFVKSGKWSDVGDLQNTGLRRTRDIFNENEQKRITSAGIELPEYMTNEARDEIGQKVWGEKWGLTDKNLGFASGGLVSSDSNNISDDLISQLLEIAAQKYNQFAPQPV